MFHGLRTWFKKLFNYIYIVVICFCKKIKNIFLMFRMKFSIKKFFILILPPFILSFYLFNPFSKTNLPLNYFPITIIYQQTGLRVALVNLVTDFFNPIIGFDKHNLCLKNDGLLRVNDIFIDKDKYKKLESGTVGIAYVEFNYLSNTTTIYSKPGETNCIVITNTDDRFKIHLGYFGYTGKVTNSFVNTFNLHKDKMNNFFVDFSKVEFYLQHNVVSVIVIQFFVVIIAWIIFVLLIIGIYDFILKKDPKDIT